MSKKPLEGLGDKFSPRILLYGDPGSGKTTFAGSYTKGPVHIYSFDPEGLSVLRENTNSITADEYLDQNYKKKGEAYSAFWEQLRKDESDGFFQEMRGKEGLVVFDSYTTLENYLVDYVALRVLMKKPNKDGVYHLERQDWPRVTPYVLNFFKAVTALPCAVLVICHRKTIQDADNNLYFRPTIIGQQADQAPRWFSEFMLAQLKGGKLYVQVSGNPVNPAASRLFLPSAGVKTLQQPTLDDLYRYWHGKPMQCKTL